MTYHYPNRPAAGHTPPYPPDLHQRGRDQFPAPLPDDGLGWWTATLLTLCGIVARPDRMQESSKQAMTVLTLGGLAFLAAFGALVICTYITHR